MKNLPTIESEPGSDLNQDQQLLTRLQRLSDGIFMLAMMLMVLQFDLPDLKQHLSAQQVTQFLVDQLPALSIYLGTFLLIAFYWFNNLEQSKNFRKTDTVHLWLNVLSLMFVVIIPYTNDLLSVYIQIYSVKILYSFNLFIVGCLSSISWWYASRKHRLIHSHLDDHSIRYIGLESLIEPVICILTIIASLINPDYWEPTFFLIMPAYILLHFWHKNQQKSDPDHFRQ